VIAVAKGSDHSDSACCRGIVHYPGAGNESTPAPELGRRLRSARGRRRFTALYLHKYWPAGAPAFFFCTASSGPAPSLRREHLPPRRRVAPTRMLNAGALPTACRAPRLLAQHVRRRVGTPSNDEWCERDSDAVIACITAQPISRADVAIARASGRRVRVAVAVLVPGRREGSRDGACRAPSLTIDGVLSADHVTYDGGADEGHDYKDVEHTNHIGRRGSFTTTRPPSCRGR
jgi:hypothetical protein